MQLIDLYYLYKLCYVKYLPMRDWVNTYIVSYILLIAIYITALNGCCYSEPDRITYCDKLGRTSTWSQYLYLLNTISYVCTLNVLSMYCDIFIYNTNVNIDYIYCYRLKTPIICSLTSFCDWNVLYFSLE